MNDAPLTDEEVRNAFYFLKTNKSRGCGERPYTKTEIKKML